MVAKQEKIWLRLLLPPLITHVLEYVVMVGFTVLYTTGGCLPSAAAPSPTPTPTTAPTTAPTAAPTTAPTAAPTATATTAPTTAPTATAGQQSSDKEGYELRGWSESMYFALTTQTTVGCAGAQHAHIWGSRARSHARGVHFLRTLADADMATSP